MNFSKFFTLLFFCLFAFVSNGQTPTKINPPHQIREAPDSNYIFLTDELGRPIYQKVKEQISADSNNILVAGSDELLFVPRIASRCFDENFAAPFSGNAVTITSNNGELPSDVSLIDVYLNGNFQTFGVDWTLNGSNIEILNYTLTNNDRVAVGFCTAVSVNGATDNDADPSNELQNWYNLPLIPENIDTNSLDDLTNIPYYTLQDSDVLGYSATFQDVQNYIEANGIDSTAIFQYCGSDFDTISSEVIVADGRYNAFPSMTISNNKLIAAYYAGDGHTTEDELVVMTSIVGSGVWNSFVVEDNSNFRTAQVQKLRNGQIFLSGWTEDGDLFYWLSNDDGGSFTGKTQIIVPDNLATEGKLLETTSGRWIIPVYRIPSQKAGVVYSDDQGATWTLTYFQGFNAGYNETTILQKGNLLYAYTRKDTGQGANDKPSRWTSYDNGTTWVDLTDMNVPNWLPGKPEVTLLADGRMLMSHRSSATPPRGQMSISTDDGINWKQLYRQKFNQFVYGATVQLNAHQIAHIYAYENGLNRADIDLEYFNISSCQNFIYNGEFLSSINQDNDFDIISNLRAKNNLKVNGNFVELGGDNQTDGQADRDTYLNFPDDDLYITGEENDPNKPTTVYKQNGDILWGLKSQSTQNGVKGLFFDRSKGSLIYGTLNAGPMLEIGQNTFVNGFGVYGRGDNSIYTGQSSFFLAGSNYGIGAAIGSQMKIYAGIAAGASVNMSGGGSVRYSVLTGLTSTMDGFLDNSLLSINNSNGFSGTYKNISGTLFQTKFKTLDGSHFNVRTHNYTDTPGKASLERIYNSILNCSTNELDSIYNIRDAFMIGTRQKASNADNFLLIGDNIGNYGSHCVILNGMPSNSALTLSTDAWRYINYEDGVFKAMMPNGYRFSPDEFYNKGARIYPNGNMSVGFVGGTTIDAVLNVTQQAGSTAFSTYMLNDFTDAAFFAERETGQKYLSISTTTGDRNVTLGNRIRQAVAKIAYEMEKDNLTIQRAAGNGYGSEHIDSKIYAVDYACQINEDDPANNTTVHLELQHTLTSIESQNIVEVTGFFGGFPIDAKFIINYDNNAVTVTQFGNNEVPLAFQATGYVSSNSRPVLKLTITGATLEKTVFDVSSKLGTLQAAGVPKIIPVINAGSHI